MSPLDLLTSRQALAQPMGLRSYDDARRRAVFVEVGQSGSKPLAKRPEGAKLLATVKPGNVIIAVKLDRTFRDIADAANTLTHFKKQGIAVYLRDLGGDVTRDAVSELVFGLLSSVAAFG